MHEGPVGYSTEHWSFVHCLYLLLCKKVSGCVNVVLTVTLDASFECQFLSASEFEVCLKMFSCLSQIRILAAFSRLEFFRLVSPVVPKAQKLTFENL